MLTNLHQVITHNSVLKIISFVLGFTFWFSLSRSYITTSTYTVPVAVYGLASNYNLNAPESVQVTLRGRRADLAALHPQHVAVHVDGSQLHVGNNNLIISNATLFLPEHINVLSYIPLVNVITVTQHATNTQPAAATTERSPHAAT